VEAGHDYFSAELMERYFSNLARKLGLSQGEFLELGQANGNGEFCMTVLALRLASRCNGVSKLHGEVSRRMWQSLWPNVPVSDIPIRYVTNGVHFRSWVSMELNQLYDRYIGPSWHGDAWKRVYSIPAEELWRTHERRRERLVGWVRLRVRDQRIRRSAPPREIEAADEVLDPEALTIGFARRFATYKRATLILRDLNRLRRILSDSQRPVQLIFAGKAHPQDTAGKELIRQISGLSRDPELGRRVVFLEDYDMSVARYLVQGVDVWLNNPLRPNEASGTSGMKAAVNGVLNLSIPDGWWDEVWRDPNNPRSIGWAIGHGESYQDLGYQDQVEAECLYDLLEKDVIPTFFERGPDRIPRHWVERMKASIASLCPFINTHRMLGDYVGEYYLPAHDKFRVLEANGAARARELAAFLDRLHREWHNVQIQAVDQGPGETIQVGASIAVRALIHLGSLTPGDVAVELYLGRVDKQGNIVEGFPIAMQSEGVGEGGTYRYLCQTSSPRSGRHGFTIRVRVDHPDLPAAVVPGLICWADGQRIIRQAAPVGA